MKSEVHSNDLSALPPQTRKFVEATIMALYYVTGESFSDACEDSDFGNELLEWLHTHKNRITTRK